MKLTTVLAIAGLAASQAIVEVPPIQRALEARHKEENLMDGIFYLLSNDDKKIVDKHLKNLRNLHGDKCDRCKTRLWYAREGISEHPDKEHLMSLALFQNCVEENHNKERKCDNVDFFVNTGKDLSASKSTFHKSGTKDLPAVNFYDNDFLHMIKNFNMSSNMDMEYYCHYKELACDLPKTPDVEELFKLSSRWPAKQQKHNLEPVYSKLSKKTFNVLHISDLHNELRYEIGTEANCSHGLCCLPEKYNKHSRGKHYNFTEGFSELEPARAGSDSPMKYSFYPRAKYNDGKYDKGSYYDYPEEHGYNSVVLPATTFGSYRCDAPVVLFNNTLLDIAKLIPLRKFEFALFTGDLVDHDADHCTPEVTKYAELSAFEIMRDYLGNMTIFPTLGNHDTFPYGQLSPIKYSFNNLYDWNQDIMNTLWTKYGWLLKNASEEEEKIRHHYAGFSVETDRGLKIISLNSNAYYQKNLWAYINLVEEFDPFDQWQFLIDELVKSESKDQRVWIMAHIPTGISDAIPIHAEIFNKIVERFSPYTIANIFFGHTHMDQFHILYKANSSKDVSDIINMAWVTHSITPQNNHNPSWRYYEVEEETFNVINSYNYYTNLNDTFTNGGDEPKWNFEYSARETYDKKKTWPTDAPLNATFWHKYVASNLRNSSDIAINQEYMGLQYRLSPFVPNCTDGTMVSDECYAGNWCDVSARTGEEYKECKKLYRKH